MDYLLEEHITRNILRNSLRCISIDIHLQRGSFKQSTATMICYSVCELLTETRRALVSQVSFRVDCLRVEISDGQTTELASIMVSRRHRPALEDCELKGEREFPKQIEAASSGAEWFNWLIFSRGRRGNKICTWSCCLLYYYRPDNQAAEKTLSYNPR